MGDTQGRLPRLSYLDLLRGFLIFIIIVDHTQRWPGILEVFTGMGRQWASAAEAFFFLSGVMLGHVRGGRMAVVGLWHTVKKVLLRAAHLYGLAVGLTLLFLVWGLRIGDVGINIPVPVSGVSLGVVQDVFALRLSYGWTDFLGFYAVFLVYAVPLLVLIKYRLAWLGIALSGIIYALFRDQSVFLGWQFLFLSGVVVGAYYPQIVAGVRRIRRGVLGVSALVLGFLSFTTYVVSNAHVSPSTYTVHRFSDTVFIPMLDAVIPGDISALYSASKRANQQAEYAVFDRPTLGPGRLVIFALWMSTLMLVFRVFYREIQRYGGWLFTPLGTQSLTAFCVQGVVVYYINYALPPASNLLLVNFGMASLSVLSVWALTVGWGFMGKKIRTMLGLYKIGKQSP